VLNTARAVGHSQAAARSLLLAILKLGLEVLLLGLRLDVLHSARAGLEVQAAAGILNELVVSGTARAGASSLQAAAEHILNLILQFGLNSLHVTAVALGLLNAVAERVGGLLHLGHLQRLRGSGSAGGSSARGGLKSILRNTCQSHRGSTASGGRAGRQVAIGNGKGHKHNKEDSTHFCFCFVVC